MLPRDGRATCRKMSPTNCGGAAIGNDWDRPLRIYIYIYAAHNGAESWTAQAHNHETSPTVPAAHGPVRYSQLARPNQPQCQLAGVAGVPVDEISDALRQVPVFQIAAGAVSSEFGVGTPSAARPAFLEKPCAWMRIRISAQRYPMASEPSLLSGGK
jgi:hypothetical protein